MPQEIRDAMGLGPSYADAFAVVTAQKVQGIVMTGDPEIVRLKDVVAVKELKRA